MGAANSIQIPPGRSRRPQNSNANMSWLGRGFRYGWRQTRRLFHVLVGLAFLILAGIGASLAFSEWQAYAQNPSNGMWRFGAIAGFSLLLVIFGLYSFLKARSVR
jgi:hypothetical protein